MDVYNRLVPFMSAVGVCEYQDAVRNQQVSRRLDRCIEGEYDVHTRTNCGCFVGLGDSNPGKERHVPGGRGVGQNLGFPEEAPQFLSQTSCQPPDLGNTCTPVVV